MSGFFQVGEQEMCGRRVTVERPDVAVLIFSIILLVFSIVQVSASSEACESIGWLSRHKVSFEDAASSLCTRQSQTLLNMPVLVSVVVAFAVWNAMLTRSKIGTIVLPGLSLLFGALSVVYLSYLIDAENSLYDKSTENKCHSSGLSGEALHECSQASGSLALAAVAASFATAGNLVVAMLGWMRCRRILKAERNAAADKSGYTPMDA